MSTNIPDVHVTNYKSKIKKFADRELAIEAMLSIENAQYCVTNEHGKKIIQQENDKKNPNILSLIRRIVDEQENIPWQTVEGKNLKKACVTIGHDIYNVEIQKTEENDKFIVDIKEKSKMVKDGGKEVIQMEKSGIPPCTLKLGATEDDVWVNGKEVKAARLAGMQANVVSKIGENLPKSALVVMGTGSGKSFVMAGLTQAVGYGVYIVPDMSLANELRSDAIYKLQGNRTDVMIDPTVEDIEKFKKNPSEKHIILTAKSPGFDKRARALQGLVILMDESHQHTYRRQDLARLKNLIDNNTVIGLTGTPTSALSDPNMLGQPITSVNILDVMKTGKMRFIQGSSESIKYDSEANSASESNMKNHVEKVQNKMLERYFNGVGYLSPESGMVSGYRSPESYLNKDRSNIADAVEKSVINNRKMNLQKKNFIFSGDEASRKALIKAHNDISLGKGNKALEKNIKSTIMREEIEARISMWRELDPDFKIKTKAEVTKLMQNNVEKMYKDFNLKDEIENAQKLQIAQSLNAKVLSIIYGGKPDDREFESMQRLGRLEKYLEDNPAKQLTHEQKDKLLSPYIKDLSTVKAEDRGKCFASSLPKDQRAKIIDLIVNKVNNIQPGSNVQKSLLTTKDIDLKSLEANYAVDAPARHQPENKRDDADQEANKILDQLRLGLVIHVGSDERFATGISIPSVLSVQQMITRADDPLMNAQLSVQLFGRNIRGADDVAVASQVSSDLVATNLYLKPNDLVNTTAAETAITVDKLQQKQFGFDVTLITFDENFESDFKNKNKHQQSLLVMNKIKTIHESKKGSDNEFPFPAVIKVGEQYWMFWSNQKGDNIISPVHKDSLETVKSYKFPEKYEKPMVLSSFLKATACPKAGSEEQYAAPKLYNAIQNTHSLKFLSGLTQQKLSRQSSSIVESAEPDPNIKKNIPDNKPSRPQTL